MPPRIETHLELFLDNDVLATLNQTFNADGLEYVLRRNDGTWFAEVETRSPCNGQGLCRKPPEAEPGTCECGCACRSGMVEIGPGPLCHITEIRQPGASRQGILELGQDMVKRESSLRFELQSTLEELISKYEELTVVYESAETIVSINDLEGVAQRILDQAADILDVDHASLMLSEDDVLVVKAARGARLDRVGTSQPLASEQISSYVAKEGKPVLIEDLATDPQFGRGFNRESDQARSLVSVPLKVRDRVLGVLNVNHKRSGEPFNSGDLKLLMALGSLAAISIENARIYQNAITDRLTSLYNYGYFREQLDKLIENARVKESTLCLIMFDIDHFKNFNDVNGHDKANVALVGVSSLCMVNSRQKGDRVPDLVARYGGEEFMILLSGVTKDAAFITADRIRERVERTEFDGGQNQPMGKVTISMGVACYPEDGSTGDELIGAADQALYRAKRGGRNNVQKA